MCRQIDIQSSNQAQTLQPLPDIYDAQTPQTLEFWHAQYMGDHHEIYSLVNYTFKPKLNAMCNITNQHMVTPTVYMPKPTHERTLNNPPQQCN